MTASVVGRRLPAGHSVDADAHAAAPSVVGRRLPAGHSPYAHRFVVIAV